MFYSSIKTFKLKVQFSENLVQDQGMTVNMTNPFSLGVLQPQRLARVSQLLTCVSQIIEENTGGPCVTGSCIAAVKTPQKMVINDMWQSL